MNTRSIAKTTGITIARLFWEFVVAMVRLTFEICRGLLKGILLLIGIRFAPQATGDIIVATRQRKQRKRIEALEAEVEKLKQSS